jgi:hypothetical protein
MIRVLGIDPGLDGALAVLDLHQGGRILHLTTVTPTPTLDITVRKKKRRDYDVPGMWHLVEEAAYPANVTVAMVGLEHQGPRPKEGVVSSYRTGHGYGLWRALVVAAQLPMTIVQPVVWRREFGLLRAGKQASIKAAVEGFPEYPSSLTRHHGAADAILIAAFVARRRVVPEAPHAAPPPAPESVPG